MANWTVVKSFHQDGEGHVRGDEIVETMDFDSFEAADAYGLTINAQHEELPFHISSVVLDNRNFVFFDKTPIFDAHNLYGIDWQKAA